MKKYYFKFKVGLILYYDHNSILNIALNYLFFFVFIACIIFYGFCCQELGYWYPSINHIFDSDCVYTVDVYINFFRNILLIFFLCHCVFYVWFGIIKSKNKDFYNYVIYSIYRKKIYKEKKKMSIEDYEYFVKFQDKGVFLNGINAD